ncbi:DeoR/GlpR family DNA-binding transcription regulator [Arthrobacter sp. D1-29]
MNRQERLAAILDMLAQTGQIDIDDVVHRFGVSQATARRDIDSLAARRLLSRTHGGAEKGSVAYDLPGRYNRNDNARQKEEIARTASSLIPKGAVIGLCGGTTSTALAQVLATRDDLQEPSDRPTLTVVTNAINIAAQLAVRPNIKVMVTGGVLNPRSYELVGPHTDIILERIALDLAFVGVNGIDTEVGPTIADEAEAAVNTSMARRAMRAYILADSSKIGNRAFATMSGFNFTQLITDSGISDQDRKRLVASGVTVLTGDKPPATGTKRLEEQELFA